MSKKPEIAVLYHLFYEDSFERVCEELQPLLSFNTTFLFNICADTPDKRTIIDTLQQKFDGAYIISTSNKGKDIGAKLALLQLFLQLQIEPNYFLFLHDKKSLQALKSSTWKKDLLKIVEPGNIEKIMTQFDSMKTCGMIATKEYIIHEPNQNGQFSGNNGEILDRLLNQYNLRPGSFEFVAGTMFWARVKPIRDFFVRFSPLDIRKTLEDENVLDNFSGTHTHSWERMFSWLVTSQGYSIKGI